MNQQPYPTRWGCAKFGGNYTQEEEEGIQSGLNFRSMIFMAAILIFKMADMTNLRVGVAAIMA